MPVLEVPLQSLDGGAGDQPPEGVEIAPREQPMEDGGERILSLENQQHLIGGR